MIKSNELKKKKTNVQAHILQSRALSKKFSKTTMKSFINCW